MPEPGRECPHDVSRAGTAAQILRQAGVQLKWRSAESACLEGMASWSPSHSRPRSINTRKRWLMQSIRPRQQRIVLFYDRVLTAAGPAVAPYLLGHVLAHEIVHILQGVDQHSESGLMRARWDNRDYFDMQRANLKLSET